MLMAIIRLLVVGLTDSYECALLLSVMIIPICRQASGPGDMKMTEVFAPLQTSVVSGMIDYLLLRVIAVARMLVCCVVLLANAIIPGLASVVGALMRVGLQRPVVGVVIRV